MALPVQEKLVCSVCKGTFFSTARAEQFIAGGYGSAEFRSISNAPKTVLICIGCGTPHTPKPTPYSRGTQAYLDEEAFRKSVEAGQKYREDSSIQHVAQIAASPAEVQELRTLVNDVKKAVEAMAKPEVKLLPRTTHSKKAKTTELDLPVQLGA